MNDGFSEGLATGLSTNNNNYGGYGMWGWRMDLDNPLVCTLGQ